MRATSIQKALFSFFPILFMYRINSVAFASEAEVQVKVNDIAEIVPSTMPVSGMPNLTAQLFYFLAEHLDLLVYCYTQTKKCSA